jgi:CBS domain-containing protein
MDRPIRRPEEILAYRPLQQMLASRSTALWTVRPTDSVLKALEIMADKDIGCLLVMEDGRMAGIVSERDCARRVVLTRKPAEATPVADIMTRDVVTVDLTHNFADCLKLMHQHGIRHLPVVENGRPITVLSIRDFLGEAVAHQARIIAELERERMTIFTSMA